MREEVLEHLEDCFNREDECLLNRDYAKILRNYIIDLKQENKQLKEEKRKVREYIKTHTKIIPFNEIGEGGGLELTDYDIVDLLKILGVDYV